MPKRKPRPAPTPESGLPDRIAALERESKLQAEALRALDAEMSELHTQLDRRQKTLDALVEDAN